MRRADRLFQIIQGLHHERVVTARYLAEQLEVSERTIYRDIQDLSLSGVPITGEAGLGHHLWCELRDSFRHFRLDRMSNITRLEVRYESAAGRTLQDFLAQCE